MPLAELTVKTTPSVLKLSVAEPPAAMAESAIVWVTPSLARVRVTWPAAPLVNV